MNRHGGPDVSRRRAAAEPVAAPVDLVAGRDDITPALCLVAVTEAQLKAVPDMAPGVRPVVTATILLADAAGACAPVQSGHAGGRIVLKTGGERP